MIQPGRVSSEWVLAKMASAVCGAFILLGVGLTFRDDNLPGLIVAGLGFASGVAIYVAYSRGRTALKSEALLRTIASRRRSV